MTDPNNISPRTGKPKRAPRGRPFNRSADPRRNGQTLEPRAVSELCPACIARGESRPGTLHERIGRFGAFIGCTAYPACSYTQKKSATPTEPTPEPSAFAPTPAPTPDPLAPVDPTWTPIA